MDIQITLGKDDWKKYQSHIEREVSKHQKSWMNSPWVNMLVWMIVAFVFMAIYRQYNMFHWPTAISVGAFFMLVSAIFILNLLRVKKAFEPSEEGFFCGRHKFKFTPEGIESEGDGYKGVHSWAIVKKVDRSDGMILIYLDAVHAFIFPEEKLSSPDEFYGNILDLSKNVTRPCARAN